MRSLSVRRLLVVLCVALLPVTGFAAGISDMAWIRDANGVVLQTRTFGEPDTPGLNEIPIAIIMPGTINGPFNSFAELSDPGSNLESDHVQLMVNTDKQQILVEFSSDADLVNRSACGPGPCIPETGAPQDMTALLFPAGNAPFHVWMQSDVTEVPEPSTAPLLLAGVVGFAAMRLVRASR